jgi:quinol monooxygenase YgiN
MGLSYTYFIILRRFILITVIAEVHLLPGKENLFIKKFVENAKWVRANEKGCLMYMPHVKVEDPATVVVIEKWASQADLDAHMKSPKIKASMEEIDKYTVGGPQMYLLKELG